MAKAKMTGRDTFTLILLVAMSVFLYADQRIMSAILPELAGEYAITERTLGFIGSAFTLVGAFVSIFFGYFTDKISRKNLLILTVIIGEVPCFLTGFPFFTQTVGAFVTLRILTGIGIGGIYPITFSLISDYFKEEHRASASAWLGVSWAIGALIGPGLAGYMTGTYGWRMPFIIAAAPNFLLVIIFAFFAGIRNGDGPKRPWRDLYRKGSHINKRLSSVTSKSSFPIKPTYGPFSREFQVPSPGAFSATG